MLYESTFFSNLRLIARHQPRTVAGATQGMKGRRCKLGRDHFFSTIYWANPVAWALIVPVHERDKSGACAGEGNDHL
jgi:hypothetical protein